MKKNVAGQTIGAQMIDASTGGAFTSTVSVVVTGDAGTQGAGSGAVTHEGNGYHSYAPSQAETNYDHVAFTFTGTGAVPATVQVYTTFPQTGDSFARIGAPVGASISADVAGVQSDTNDIQTRLPAALVSGRIDASVGAMASGVLTATAIAADAITDAKVASDVTIASVTGAVGSVTGNVGGNVTGSVGSVAAGGIAAASFAAGAINAAAIAADAIGASELAADAVAEIADAVWDEARAGHVAAGSFGEGVASVQGNVTGSVASVTGAVGSVTGNVGGNVTGSVGSVATGGIAAASFAAGAIDAAAIAANAIGASELAADAVAEIADAVWDELLSGHVISGSAGEALAAAGTAGDPWTTVLPGAYGAGTAGKIIGDNLNATVSSRASQTSVDTIDDFLDTEIAAILADTNELQTDWTNGGRLDLLVDAIKAKTDNLPAAPAATGDIPTAAAVADAVWDEALAGHSTAGSAGKALTDAGTAGDPWSTALPGAYGAGTAGKIIGDNIDAAISTRLATASYTAPLDAAGTRSAIGLASANLDTQIGTLATASALATVDTVVDAILVDTAEIGAAGAGLTALASQASVNTIDDFLDTEIAAIKAKTDNLPAAPAATGDIPSAATIADAVWDEAIAGHLGAGSTGEALNAAGAAGDPWTTTLPGAYGAGSAGYIIGNNIDAPISTVDTVVDAIKAKTDSLAFTVAGQVDANIQYVNDVQVNGTGTAGNPWGP